MKIIGFNNVGNTCYLASVLQCFIYDTDFIKFIENSTNNELTVELKKIINGLNNDLRNLIRIVIREKPWFNGFEQNDSHEFLMCFMDILIDKTKNQNIINEPVNKSWDMFINGNNSEITKYYHGQTKSIITCQKCNNSKNIYGEYCTLDLNVPEKNDGTKLLSIYDLFNNYLKNEVNDDLKNLYYCDFCKDSTICTKKTGLWKLPKKLIIVLNRYSNNNRKINTPILFPIKSLLINESMTKKVFKYTLKSVVNHYGISHGGHYTSIIINNEDKYFIDDSNINVIQKINNKDPSTYILFYEECE